MFTSGAQAPEPYYIRDSTSETAGLVWWPFLAFLPGRFQETLS